MQMQWKGTKRKTNATQIYKAERKCNATKCKHNGMPTQWTANAMKLKCNEIQLKRNEIQMQLYTYAIKC